MERKVRVIKFFPIWFFGTVEEICQDFLWRSKWYRALSCTRREFKGYPEITAVRRKLVIRDRPPPLSPIWRHRLSWLAWPLEGNPSVLQFALSPFSQWLCMELSGLLLPQLARADNLRRWRGWEEEGAVHQWITTLARTGQSWRELLVWHEPINLSIAGITRDFNSAIAGKKKLQENYIAQVKVN